METITRRGSLAKIGGFVISLVGAGGWLAGSAEGGPAGVASGAVTCVLTPEMTEGPYYISGEKNRRNVTDGKPGAPLALRLSVVNASTCKPVKGAAVEIWHADATGAYSGFGAGAASRTFLRGVQKTDAKGVARFDTIYPGWYPGRAVHIHVMVHLAGNVVHTGQLFFPDTLTDKVYKQKPYSARPNRSNYNLSDSIYLNGGKNSTLALTARSAGGYTGAITMGVNAA